MTPALPLPVEIISQPDRLDLAVRILAGSPAIALDTESNSFYRYPEQMCLIQIADAHNIYIIDTILLKDVTPLKKILEDPSIQKVIHGADYDVRSLDRHYGFRINNLYDTAIAARFTGIMKFGLADLIQDLLGITINKSKRLQRADWALRPLSGEALEYAAGDVFHLFTLRDILDKRLLALGRKAWVDEECARMEKVRYNIPDLETAFLSVKESQYLDGRGLAVLRSLFLFRDAEAHRQHRPPFFVMPDNALIFLASNPAAPLSDVPGLGESGMQRFGKGLRQALSEGLTAPLINRPVIIYDNLRPEQFQRLRRLKEWRTEMGIALSLDPSLLFPAVSLERLAREPGSLDTELASPDIRRWQIEQFAGSLRSILKSLP